MTGDRVTEPRRSHHSPMATLVRRPSQKARPNVSATGPFGGWSETSATVVFGLWFLICLALAFAAVRRRDIAEHRRWMIRAFAVGTGIATIRLWVGAFIGLHHALTAEPPNGPVADTFGLAFWLGLTTNVAIGEWWLRRGSIRRSPLTTGSAD